jgi:hypothetical protein
MTAVVANDILGNIYFEGCDGTNFVRAARIFASTVGVVAGNQVPSTLTLQTATAAGSLTNGLVIDQAQQVQVTAATASTTTANGALVVAGGAGIAGQLTAKNLSAIVGTITTALPAVDGSVTWNAGAVSFTGIRLLVTSTASAAASLLIDLQVGGVSQFKVDKAGLITSNSPTLHATSVGLTNGAAANAGTLTNAPAAGNPTKWAPVNDNGTTRYVPLW